MLLYVKLLTRRKREVEISVSNQLMCGLDFIVPFMLFCTGMSGNEQINNNYCYTPFVGSLQCGVMLGYTNRSKSGLKIASPSGVQKNILTMYIHVNLVLSHSLSVTTTDSELILVCCYFTTSITAIFISRSAALYVQMLLPMVIHKESWMSDFFEKVFGKNPKLKLRIEFSLCDIIPNTYHQPYRFIYNNYISNTEKKNLTLKFNYDFPKYHFS